MKTAAIISTARTPVGKAFHGSLNNIKSPTLMAHSMVHAVKRAGIEPAEIEDVVVGSVLTAGTAGINIARMAILAADWPEHISGQTVDRQCASGLMAINIAAQQIKSGEMQTVLAGGQDNISALQHPYLQWVLNEKDPQVIQHSSNAYMPMLETAEHIAQKYSVSRQQQDEYALISQIRATEAQLQQKFDNEIASISATRAVKDKKTREVVGYQDILLEQDEGIRPSTSALALEQLAPILEGGTITAGNASQMSDGSSASILVELEQAQKRSLPVLGIYRDTVVAGTAPEEMGLGPLFAIPKLLKRNGLKTSDIGLWEINEAFACQLLICRDQLGIDPQLCNVNGGAIAMGHPYGMTGLRMCGHALLEGRKRGVKYVVVSMCVGGGMGVASLFELPT